ncbi:E3 ubiquitin-protein ligase Os03g0188200-like [Aegilops tauschii subsp. strangulata]|uniref:E3 ubiquitin-protein ligase Os03g0188200-like n=1 Tax=Aegilops tauschii subsp. strangulata TaxID=200361 RepID=UPI000989C3B8|nr:E3 ubiquitin-protein ligase Os03g0188200-like [Aegilops tauschii subsp. strangulata]
MPGSTVLLISCSIAALLVISLFTFLCSNRRQAHRAPPSQSERSVVDVELGHGCGATGMDDAVLAVYTTTVYSAAKRRGEDQMAVADALADGDQPPDDTDTHTTCAVCLTEYMDGDELRRLPGCKHAFHRLCVDEWLRRRPSCPLCRTSPLATRTPPAATTDDS